MIEYGLVQRLEDDATVGGIAGDRIYPLKLPQNVTLPAITYSRVSGERGKQLAGLTGYARPTFQFDLWAQSYNSCKLLAKAVRESLDGFQGTMDSETVYRVQILNEIDDFEEDLIVYRTIQDYEVFHQEL